MRVVNGTVSSPTNQFGEASIAATDAARLPRPRYRLPWPARGLPVWERPWRSSRSTPTWTRPRPTCSFRPARGVSAQGPLAFSFSDYQISGRPRRGGRAWRRSCRSGPGAQASSPSAARTSSGCSIPSTTRTQATRPRRRSSTTCGSTSCRCTTQLAWRTRGACRSGGRDPRRAAGRGRPDQSLMILLGYSAHLMEGNDIGGIDVGFLGRDTVRIDSLEQLGKDTIFAFPGAQDAPLTIARHSSCVERIPAATRRSRSSSSTCTSGR